MTAAAYSYNATEADYLNGTVGNTPANWTLGTPLSSFQYGNDLSPQEGLTVGQILSNAAGRGFVRRDLGVGNEFDLLNNDLSWWFFYVKGKGDAILTDVPVSGEWPVSIRVYSDATPGANWSEWDLAGNDTLIASWNFFLISGNQPTRTGTVPANLSAVRHLEFRFDFARSTTGGFTSADEPIGLDFIKYGNTITITGGTSPDPAASFAGLAAWSAGDEADRVNDPAQGLVIKEDVFNSVAAAISFGDGVAATEFEAENEFLLLRKFGNSPQRDIDVTNNATVTLGTKDVGDDDTYAINGCNIVVPAVAEDGSDLSGGFEDIDVLTGGVLNAYATKFFRWRSISLRDVDIIDCDFDTNRAVDLLSTAVEIQNTKIHDAWAIAGFQAAGAFQDDGGSRTDITTDWNSQGGSTPIFPASEVVGDSHIFGDAEKSKRCEFNFATPGVGGAVTFQYWNGAGWSNLTGVVDGTNNFTQDGIVEWDVPPDWEQSTILTREAYYIRALIGTVYTTNPLISFGRFVIRSAGTISAVPTTFQGNRIFNLERGYNFAVTGTYRNYIATDCLYDLLASTGTTITLVDSQFDRNKILEI